VTNFGSDSRSAAYIFDDYESEIRGWETTFPSVRNGCGRVGHHCGAAPVRNPDECVFESFEKHAPLWNCVTLPLHLPPSANGRERVQALPRTPRLKTQLETVTPARVAHSSLAGDARSL
jgi:hypothetical protein